ncbi:MAG: sigma-70 family RNA polymerase sigma factor [Phycisphaeraceae bacterium]|nr:sigma-70 family RNA polymerase sigma factor [Phycisphaeraceae bacterium]
MTTSRDAPGNEGGVDASLLEAAARGDAGAWRTLVGSYAHRVFALARSRMHDDDRAEEITQSVFVTVATKLRDGGYSERGRFESWLFRVAMNRIRDEARRERRQASPVAPESLRGVEAREPEESPYGDVAFRALREALSQLGEADREVIHLRHQAGMSFKEIAELLGEPLGTLLARHHRALRKLKAIMGSRREALP